MHPDIEKLINIALKDGILTNKEREIIFRKGKILGVDEDELEMILEGRLSELQSENNIKCPNCGAEIPAFSTVCSFCKHEIRSKTANLSVKELSEKLENILVEVEKMSFKDKTLIGNVFDTKDEQDNRKKQEINKRQSLIIKSFPIPNTRDDILEFLHYIQPKTKLGLGADANVMAWRMKYNEVISRAKFAYKNDKNMLTELSEFETNNNNPLLKFFAVFSQLNKQAKFGIIAGSMLVIMIIILLNTSFPKQVEKSYNVSPQKNEISGFLINHIEVVPNQYEIIRIGKKANISVNIKLKNKFPIDTFKTKSAYLSMNIFDNNGSPVSNIDEFHLSSDELSKLNDFLKLDSGNQVLNFSTSAFNNKDSSKIVKFVITGIIKDIEIDNNSNETNENAIELEDNTNKLTKSEKEEAIKKFNEQKEDALDLSDGKKSAWDGSQTTFTFKNSPKVKELYKIHTKETLFWLSKKEYKNSLKSINELYNLLINYPDSPNKDVIFDMTIFGIVNSLIRDNNFEDAKIFCIDFKIEKNKINALNIISSLNNTKTNSNIKSNITEKEKNNKEKGFNSEKEDAYDLPDGKSSAWDGTQNTFTYKESDRAKKLHTILSSEALFWIEQNELEKAIIIAYEIDYLLIQYSDAPNKNSAFDKIINEIIKNLIKEKKYNVALVYCNEFKSKNNKKEAKNNIKQFQN